jgi:hypothetical protein
MPAPVQADPIADFLFPWMKPPVPDYVRIGDKVIYEDEDVYLEASPAILTSSGWVIFKYKTKTFTDEMDVVYGFNDNLQISKPQFLNPYAVRTKYNEVTSIKTATFEPKSIISSVEPKYYVKADVGDNALNSKVAVVDCEVESSMIAGIVGKTTTTRQTRTIAYDTFDGVKYTYKYIATDQIPYTVIEEGIDDIKSPITTSSFNSQGMNKWQSVYSGKTAYANQLNETKVYIDIPFAGTERIEGKYLVGLKPSYLTVDQAKSDGQLWLIDPWYNSSWGYKKSIGINCDTNQTNYQMKLIVGYSAAATGENVDCNSHCQTDFDDLRFTTANETTLLDYWIEQSQADGASYNATVWVEVDSISSANTTVIYMYYGNAGAGAASNGANTFGAGMFDDFEDYADEENISNKGNITWTPTEAGGGTIKVDTATFYSGSRSMRITRATADINVAMPLIAGTSYAIRYWFKKDTAAASYLYHGNGTNLIYFIVNQGETISYYDSASHATGSSVNNDWQVFELNDINYATPKFDIWFQNEKITNDAGMFVFGGLSNVLAFYGVEIAGTSWIDAMIVRKWTADEPTWGSFGAEVGYSSELFPSTTTNNATNVQDTTATFNATTTAGSSLTLRGFAWGTTSNTTTITGEVPPACYTSNWTESGAFSLGNFSYNKTGLTAGTTYYYRGYSYNATGYGWGNEVSFLTKPAAPTNVAASNGTSTANVTVTWTASTGATNYYVFRDAVQISGTLGAVTTYNDTTAAPPTVGGGVVTASDGTYVNYVNLSVGGESSANGTTYAYRVRAGNVTGNSTDSSPDDGWRGAGALNYQWLRSSTDADVVANYSTLGVGAITDPYNDTTAPSDGSGRYFKAVISSPDAASANATANRGHRSPTPTVSTTGSTGLGDTWAVGSGNFTANVPIVATQLGVDYGLTNAYGNSYVTSGVYSAGAFSIYISALSSGTVYHYRAKALVEGVWYYGGDSVFSTIGAATPFVSWGVGGGPDSGYINSSNITYQTFTTNETATPYSVTKINLMLRRVGLPGIVTASVRATTLPPTTLMSGNTTTTSNATGFVWGTTSNATYTGNISPPATYTSNYTAYSTNLAAGAFTYGASLVPSQLYYYRGDSYNTTGWYYSANNTAIYGTPPYPVGVDILSGTLDGATLGLGYSWYTFTMATETCLTPNTVYAIVLQCADADISNYVLWQAQAVGAYAGGNSGHSVDSGTTWTHDLPKDQLFEVWGNPCFTLSDAKVFSSYINTGDWLITCLYKNLYPPYYAQAKDVSSLFVIQLYNPATATVIAQTKCFEWGYKPGAIYIAPSGTTHLQWGYPYRVRLYGLFSGNPYTEYVLQPTDYLGSDLTRLDAWVRSCASLMETYYGTSLTTYLTGRGIVLNSAGGVIFATDIPQLSVIRPNLFSIVSATTTPTTGEYGQLYQDILRWEVLLGPQLTRAFTSTGNTVGVSGATIGSWLGFLIYALVALFCFRPGHAIAAMVIPVPLLLIAFGTGLAELALMGILIAVAIVLFSWQVWFKGG